MFRSNQYCSRYKETPIQLDSALTIPGNNGIQTKIGYKFTINDRSSYFDWFNGFFEIKFVVNQLDGWGGYDGSVGKIATIINGSTLLINNLSIKKMVKLFMKETIYFLLLTLKF